eukprot:CAMPEP_0201479336 /NCGR_PEP_ID=MMETSP0151_2-20130828/4047_1 /ASSEMBLY_ACC=CAM_ASM_000257 /TAXON_ID=200890 /ORGANISM="Paramoeba atlantica, Strain 621/1 / CCAP 1560/9" /LENGTH=363 /DNA_ID=CAMNT_0047860785 /DNA_START=180 /DNA_END=1268 /DNA_ORIENTATION=-
MDKCPFSDFVSSVDPVPGLHVLCLQEEGDGKFSLSGYRQGFRGNGVAQSTYHINNLQTLRMMIELYFEMEPEVRDSNNRMGQDEMARQPWGLFSGEGMRINSLVDAVDSGILLIFEGGQFIWPGVEVGFRRDVGHISGKDNGIVIETVSLKPLVLAIEGFLEEGECDKIRADSEIHMAPSPVAHKDNDVGKPATEWRTSTQHWLGPSGRPWLGSIDRRVADLTRVPQNHQEHVQVLRYMPGQKYDAHHDYFDITHYRANEQIQKMLHYGTKNRMATVFWYLTDVDEGGSTWFPKADNTPHPGQPGGAKSFASCEADVGLHSYPRKGKVIIFYSLLPSGESDDLSLHAGCPPHNEGTKWSANKW